MRFSAYQTLARQVYPDLPKHFESLPDAHDTFMLVKAHAAARQHHQLNDPARTADKFSVDNMSSTQMWHHSVFGRSFWKKPPKPKK